MPDDLSVAHDLADLADAVTLPRFRAADLTVDTKPDLTPVSDADRAVEAALREHLARVRPDDAVLGEEYGGTGSGSRRWIVDPVDSTKNFVRGVPVWASLVALEEGGLVTAGVVTAPALGRRWWAARGSGAYAGPPGRDGDRLAVSGVRRLEDAHFSFSSLAGWEAAGRLDGLLELARRCWRTRAFGDFWPYVLVAEGGVDIAAEPEVSLWDLAAPKIVVEEAGGRFTDLGGRDTADGGSGVATNGRLHADVLALLGR